jgi:hypothetical protein
MAEKSRYPQIPSTVWWGVRSILIKSPKTTIDERLLGIELKVQAAAAKQYITELVAVGILAEDKKATPLAEKWRLDATYKGAVSELIASVYPQSLRDVAPADGADRQKAVAWFLQEGLGEGSAKNKAATYFLLGTPDPTNRQRAALLRRARSTNRYEQLQRCAMPARQRKLEAQPAAAGKMTTNAMN